MRMVTLGVCVFFVLSCGGHEVSQGSNETTSNPDGSTAAGTPTYDQFPQAYLAAICAGLTSCMDAAALGSFDCEGQFSKVYMDIFQPLVDGVSQGTATYDPATAARCLSGARHLSCAAIDALTVGNIAPETQELQAAGCSAVFVATR